MDVASNGVEALKVVPGLTDQVASAIVAERLARGPFHEVAELKRVPGMSKAAVERVRPFVTTGDAAPAGPIDLNAADAPAFEKLPGIGPSLAARIVADRAARGPFKTVDELDRVSGVGPATLERIRALVLVGATP